MHKIHYPHKRMSCPTLIPCPIRASPCIPSFIHVFRIEFPSVAKLPNGSLLNQSTHAPNQNQPPRTITAKATRGFSTTYYSFLPTRNLTDRKRQKLVHKEKPNPYDVGGQCWKGRVGAQGALACTFSDDISFSGFPSHSLLLRLRDETGNRLEALCMELSMRDGH